MGKKEVNVLDHINKFIPFDISKIFKFGDPVIFGGAVRDSIANMPIHDIDIISTGDTTHNLHDFLSCHNYQVVLCRNECWDVKMNDDNDLRSYHNRLIDNRCKICKDVYEIEWFDVVTYLPKCSKYDLISEERKNFVPIQLIKPKLGHFFCDADGKSKGFRFVTNQKEINRSDISDVKKFILNNVDLSCCGVFYDGNLNESIIGAIEDCEKKRFVIRQSAEFYNLTRTSSRIQKLYDRGWHNVTF